MGLVGNEVIKVRVIETLRKIWCPSVSVVLLDFTVLLVCPILSIHPSRDERLRFEDAVEKANDSR